jgi:hypothetical protein
MDVLDVTPYDSDVINVLSTLSDRTISSAQLFVTGFYPPTTDNEVWNDALDWQPIPVYATPKAMDKVSPRLPVDFCAKIASRIFTFNTLFSTYSDAFARKILPPYNLEMILNVNNGAEMREFYQQYEYVFDTVKENAKISYPEGDIATAINELVHMRDNFIIDVRSSSNKERDLVFERKSLFSDEHPFWTFISL